MWNVATLGNSILPQSNTANRRGPPKKTTDKLQRVLNSAARIVSNTHKFDRGFTHFRRSQLHWLDVVDRVRFRVCVQVFRCLHKMAPKYLSTYCQPVSGISGRRQHACAGSLCRTRYCFDISVCLSVCRSVRLDTHTTKLTDGLTDMSNFLDQLLELSIEHHNLSILVPDVTKFQ